MCCEASLHAQSVPQQQLCLNEMRRSMWRGTKSSGLRLFSAYLWHAVLPACKAAIRVTLTPQECCDAAKQKSVRTNLFAATS